MNRSAPFFSVVIPTYNRPGQLKACLSAISELNYPPDCFEVIVVDDGSPFSMESAVACVRNQLDIKLLTQSNRGPASARNTGAANAKGTFLAFIDDDCMPRPDWLQLLASRLRETPEGIIGGKTINLLADNIYSTTSQIILDVVYRHYNRNSNQPRFFATNNMALHADSFLRLGGFDADFITSEDREFCDRCLWRGFQMTYAPEVVIYHAHDLKFHTFCRQHFNYGRGALQFHLARSRRGSGSSLHDLKFHLNLGNWLGYPFSQVQSRRAASLTALLIVWQITNAAGFFWEAGSRSIRSIRNLMSCGWV